MFALARNVSYAAKSAVRAKHTLPPLGYEFNALEPNISSEIMEIHYTKHHQTYVNNLNAAEEQLAEAQSKNNVSKIITLGSALRFNGGGHINHSIFWKNLSAKSTKPSSELQNAIDEQFCSFANFKKEMSTMSVGVQGSGWGWLGYNKKTGKLELATCANQDPLEPTHGLVPLLGIDVWEHAYYLQYKNVRPTYVEKIFEVINWDDVSARFKTASSC